MSGPRSEQQGRRAVRRVAGLGALALAVPVLVTVSAVPAAAPAEAGELRAFADCPEMSTHLSDALRDDDARHPASGRWSLRERFGGGGSANSGGGTAAAAEGRSAAPGAGSLDAAAGPG